MMMRMLEGGGLAILTDGLREADEDNPRGYWEYEPVKQLEEAPDKSWLAEARGKVLKVISHLLKELPDGYAYRVIFMGRALEEVVASQNKMLERRGEANPIEDARAVDLYRKHLIHTRLQMRDSPNFEFIEIPYRDAIEAPARVAERVSDFLGGSLDLTAMRNAIDPTLYRNRSN